MINDILIAVAVLGTLAVILGITIIIIGKVFAVKRDPLVDEIIEILPSVNCGACGFPGCEQFAIEIVKTRNSSLRCPVGKEKVANAIKELLEKNKSEGSNA